MVRFVAGGQSVGSGIPAVLESGAVAQRNRVPHAGGIRRRTGAGLRSGYALPPSAPSSFTTPTDSHKHWYIKGGQITTSCSRLLQSKEKPDPPLEGRGRRN